MNLQTIKNRFGIIGNTPSINYALEVATQVAPTDLTVLIQGESGVGKEVFSQVIHSLSNRKHEELIAINCGAIPEGTIDSELFGHEKGSFTSAIDARKGYFETVNGGTIFLDEIGEMPIGTQARLLRVLETGEFIRVGSSKVLKTDVRVVAATNKDLKQLISQNKFREDLFYRLSTVPIRVAPLRERKLDIMPLFARFSQDFADRYHTPSIKLDKDAEELLINYYWPGNIRELKNVAEQISVLTDHVDISRDDLKKFLKFNEMEILPVIQTNDNIAHGFSNNSERDILYKLFFDLKTDFHEMKKIFADVVSFKESNLESVSNVKEIGNTNPVYVPSTTENTMVIPNLTGGTNDVMYHPTMSNYTIENKVEENLNIGEMEKELILKALKKHKNKRKLAASELGISERTLYRKIKEYDIEQ